MSQSLTGAESKALRLLGSNIPNHIVAQATGLSDSRISQLLSEDWFKRDFPGTKLPGCPFALVTFFMSHF